MKIFQKSSPNFTKSKAVRRIKYIILHYTGMKNQEVAIKRLQSKVAKVSCHYLIGKSGLIYKMVDENDIAWHAGNSSWRKDKNLNNSSIGIELVNNGFEKFPNKQISSLMILLKLIKKKFKIKSENILGHSDIAPDRKIDPGPLFPWYILKKNNLSNKH